MRSEVYLGIEGGGTRTVAVVVDKAGNKLGRGEFGPGNVRLLSDKVLRNLLEEIARLCPSPRGVVAGMAGAREAMDRERVRRAIEATWGTVPMSVTHDLEIALASVEQDPGTTGKVLVLSGTGSCCYGKAEGKESKVGGWGHLLGDFGSGYAIAHEALRRVVFEFDRENNWGALGKAILRELALNEPNELIGWMQTAEKSDIAALARCVFEARNDSIARKVIDRAAEFLANDAVNCARRIVSKRNGVTFILAGGVLLKQASFARKVGRLIRSQWAMAHITTMKREGAWGAAEMARKVLESPEVRLKKAAPVVAKSESGWYVPEFDPAESPTEKRNPASLKFDRLSTRGMMEVMLEAERAVVPALRKKQAKIVKVADWAAETLKRSGRIFYVGAGTSGRLGVLDASECPPTFRASPEMIQGVIAGGQRALWQAVEGAEDNAEAGATAIRFRGVTARDLVIGIAASGRTPFVWGALGCARPAGARTVLLCFNPSLKIEKAYRPDLVIAPDLGPEILTGSTRLKSGTATKLVLNMISTIAMVRLGKVISNLMVDLNPSNVKLRERAVRIVRELTGCSAEAARGALEANGWVVKKAWERLKMRV